MLKNNRNRLPLTLGLVILSALASGCMTSASRTRVLSVALVSMTHSKLPLEYRLKTGKAITSSYCRGDAPVVETGESVGMVDQLIYKAQKEHKATHLLDVLIMRDRNCLSLEANAAYATKIKLKTPGSRDFEWTTTVLPPDSERTE